MTIQDTSRDSYEETEELRDTQTKALLRAVMANSAGGYPTTREAGEVAGLDPRTSSSAQNFLRRIRVLEYGAKRVCLISDMVAHVLVPTPIAQDWLDGHLDLKPQPSKRDRELAVIAAARAVLGSAKSTWDGDVVPGGKMEALRQAIARLEASK